jgi:hypothetical protein
MGSWGCQMTIWDFLWHGWAGRKWVTASWGHKLPVVLAAWSSWDLLVYPKPVPQFPMSFCSSNMILLTFIFAEGLQVGFVASIQGLSDRVSINFVWEQMVQFKAIFHNFQYSDFLSDWWLIWSESCLQLWGDRNGRESKKIWGEEITAVQKRKAEWRGWIWSKTFENITI